MEDIATSAAAVFGGYLREAKLVAAPATIFIRQGKSMYRPSRLTGGIPTAGEIVARGTAVSINKKRPTPHVPTK